MDLYLGDSINKINLNSNCVEISDELLDCLSIVSKRYALDISAITSIDPYGDEVVSRDRIEALYNMSTTLIQLGLFDSQYLEMLKNLKMITKVAIDRKCNIISIGD